MYGTVGLIDEGTSPIRRLIIPIPSTERRRVIAVWNVAPHGLSGMMTRGYATPACEPSRPPPPKRGAQALLGLGSVRYCRTCWLRITRPCPVAFCDHNRRRASTPDQRVTTVSSLSALLAGFGSGDKLRTCAAF